VRALPLSILPVAILPGVLLAAEPPVSPPPAPPHIAFLDAEFTRRLCEAWNGSELPQKVGATSAGGNGWIDQPNKYTSANAGVQELILSRRDCSDWPRMQLTIERGADGKATCTYGGPIKVEYEKAAWAMAPTTVHWYKFATSWSMWNMPSVMKGFRGYMNVARRNLSNFGIFWKLSGRLAKETQADYTTGCSLDESDRKDIEGYLGKIP